MLRVKRKKCAFEWRRLWKTKIFDQRVPVMTEYYIIYFSYVYVSVCVFGLSTSENCHQNISTNYKTFSIKESLQYVDGHVQTCAPLSNTYGFVHAVCFCHVHFPKAFFRFYYPPLVLIYDEQKRFFLFFRWKKKHL